MTGFYQTTIVALSISSGAFLNYEAVPTLYTCEGKNISPSLTWTNTPEKTKSLVLMMTDPDAPDPTAPKTTYAHWILYNIPPKTRKLPEGIQEKQLPLGTLQGKNDGQRVGYDGPCPPIGRHRYFFRLYALDKTLPDLKEPTRTQLEKEMEGHVLEQAELVGTYHKLRLNLYQQRINFRLGAIRESARSVHVST